MPVFYEERSHLYKKHVYGCCPSSTNDCLSCVTKLLQKEKKITRTGQKKFQVDSSQKNVARNSRKNSLAGNSCLNVCFCFLAEIFRRFCVSLIYLCWILGDQNICINIISSSWYSLELYIVFITFLIPEVWVPFVLYWRLRCKFANDNIAFHLLFIGDTIFAQLFI